MQPSWPKEQSKPLLSLVHRFSRVQPLPACLRSTPPLRSLPKLSKFRARHAGHEIPLVLRSTSSNIFQDIRAWQFSPTPSRLSCNDVRLFLSFACYFSFSFFYQTRSSIPPNSLCMFAGTLEKQHDGFTSVCAFDLRSVLLASITFPKFENENSIICSRPPNLPDYLDRRNYFHPAETARTIEN